MPVSTIIPDKPKPTARRAGDDTRSSETRSALLGAGADNARQIFADLDARRLHDLTELYRERHGDDAWDHLITLLPRWRADPGLINGFHGEQALDLLPTVMNDGERFEIAQAVWTEQYMGVHEYIDLGEVKSTDHLDAAVRRRIAFAISKPTDRSGTTRRMHDTLLWLCANDGDAKERFVKKLEVTELGRAITPIHEGVRAMRAEIEAKADGWTGRVERRIRSGANTFDIALHKTEAVKVVWHVGRETARALAAEGAATTSAGDGGQKAIAAPSDTPPDTAPAAPEQPRRGWLRRLADKLKTRRA